MGIWKITVAPVNAAFALAALLLGIGISSGLLAEDLQKLEAKANAGDADAMFDAGSIALANGDYPKAFKWLSSGAEKKHAPSEAALGFMYFNGFACEKDIAKARKLYELSTAGGAHEGYNNLAHLYRYGLGGLEKDLPKAVELLEKSSDLGNEYAVNTLAQIYRGTELGEPNIGKSLHWLRLGADRNYRGCLSDLGYAYEHGIGVEVDLQKAFELFNRSIEQGSAGAKSNLGFMYLRGEGVPQDYQKALKLFEDAAAANEIGGLINLAVMRFQGLGCDRDPSAAFSLLERASGLGSDQAGRLLNEWKTKEASRDK